ncbi:hypothetical protein FLONG3_8638, partial [Fusarium longipes]
QMPSPDKITATVKAGLDSLPAKTSPHNLPTCSACSKRRSGNGALFYDIQATAKKDSPCRICVLVQQTVEALANGEFENNIIEVTGPDERRKLIESALVRSWFDAQTREEKGFHITIDTERSSNNRGNQYIYKLQHPNLTEAQIVATEQDFAKENSAMADIYQGSYFTISADMSTSMDSGIFTTCMPAKCLPLETTNDYGKTVTIYAKDTHSSHSQSMYAIDARGWTLQESLLSPRVLHYGEHDITWRCRETVTCECGYLRRDKDNCRTSMIDAARLDLLRNPEDASTWWARVIECYTSRKLSNPDDKLPALSGLAQVYKKAKNDTYLAGLWKKSLFLDLLWFNNQAGRVPFAPGGRRPKSYRAPSWSWASIDCLDGYSTYFWNEWIIRYNLTPRPIFTLIDVVCPPTTSDPTGKVGVCQLELGVKLIRATACRYDQDWYIGEFLEDTKVWMCVPDCKVETDNVTFGDEIYCAPVLELLSEGASRWGCLMLKHLQGRQYQRVGFCVLEKEDLGWEDSDEDSDGSELSIGVIGSGATAKLEKYAFQFDAYNLSSIIIV